MLHVFVLHQAQNIGKAASDFIQQELKMDFVYDYMFHLLNSYAKLFRYQPSISDKAVELCVESMVCNAQGIEKKFMMESLVKGPSNTDPCIMPPPYDPPSLQTQIKRKQSLIERIEYKEKSYWKKKNVTS